MNKEAFNLYKDAWEIINKHNYKVKLCEVKRPMTDFLSKTIYHPKYSTQEYLDSIIVHEAHHVSTSEKRLSLDIWNMSYNDLFHWFINDEKQAYTKQYEFLSYFNPMYKTLAPSFIRAQLGYYYRIECRIMANAKHLVMKHFKNEKCWNKDHLNFLENYNWIHSQKFNIINSEIYL